MSVPAKTHKPGLACGVATSKDVSPEVKAAGIEIRDTRKKRGMTQVQLAVYTNVDAVTVGRIERGTLRKPEKLSVLQAYLRCGPYTPKQDAVDALEVGTLRTSQLLALIQQASAELSMRFGEGPPAPASPQATVAEEGGDDLGFPIHTSWMSGEAPAWPVSTQQPHG